MKCIVIATLVSATLAASDAAAIPREHHARFLAEFDTTAQELAAWKDSPAGRYAKANGFFKPALSLLNVTIATDDQILRFFLSKLTAEEAQRKNPEATFGTNTPFSLMTEQEFAKYVSKSSPVGSLGLIHGIGAEASSAPDAQPDVGAARKKPVDWTTSGCVSGVKNQGWCGSCWAFSAVGALESAYCLKYGGLTLFSEQQVTDCDSNSHGCDGGLPSNALSYIRENGGVCTSSGYPYTSGASGETGTCGITACAAKALTISSVKSVTVSDSGFATAIAKQPVAVAVAAGNPTWKQYTGGVVSSCETTRIDHAVLAVGYDASSFKLKNQWGTSWGAGGYIQLKRISSKSAACSLLNNYAVYPVVA